MKKHANNIFKLMVVLSLILNANIALSDQFYFLAKAAPTGASSALGKSEGSAVYLRWDVVEGELPNDVVSLRLLRDNVSLLEVGITELRTTAEIEQLYTGQAEQQRLLNTITLLKKYAHANDSDFNASEYANALINNFENDDAWTYFASRQNFNIALSRYRAYLDMSGKQMRLGQDYTRDAMTLEEYAKRIIVAEDPRIKLATYPRRIQDAILLGKVMKGMTKEQVIMSVGYPLTQENPDMNAPMWRMWTDSLSEYRLMWRKSGKVKTITEDPVTRNLIVYKP